METSYILNANIIENKDKSITKSRDERVKPSDILLDELITDHGDALYRFCNRLTYSKEDADDLFQETFLKTLGQMDKLKETDCPQNLLYATSLYIWKGWKRKYARRSRIAPTQSLSDQTILGDFNLEDKIMAQEDSRIVREVVNTLPEKFRIPIMLYYTAQLSVSNIAATMKIPVGTVKSRLHTARKLIEKGLFENGYER